MSGKTAIMDASSAIILYKSGLHSLLTEIYDVVLPRSVYRELTVNPYTGAGRYEQMVAGRQLSVQEPSGREGRPGMSALGKGESDAIRMYYEGAGEFVITDDGQAARFCKREGVPFINALLFPVVLQLTGIRENDFCRRAMDKVLENGRYSREVIAFARRCRREAIAFAIP